ncbi:hypothetical protein B0H14DRAFT_2634956 [Mycena olivaceomarginata]|nr:hypothetical protein B0H14DRAFT_2634956 [Mycena olivaceomarginata]
MVRYGREGIWPEYGLKYNPPHPESQVVGWGSDGVLARERARVSECRLPSMVGFRQRLNCDVAEGREPSTMELLAAKLGFGWGRGSSRRLGQGDQSDQRRSLTFYGIQCITDMMKSPDYKGSPATPLVLSDCPLGQKVVRAAGNRCGHGLELGPKGLKKILKDITRALREDPVIANDTRFYSLHGHRSPAKGSGKTSAEKAAEEAVEAEQPQHAPTGTLLAQKVKTDSPGQFTKLPAKDGPKGSSATDSDTHYGASPSHLVHAGEESDEGAPSSPSSIPLHRKACTQSPVVHAPRSLSSLLPKWATHRKFPVNFFNEKNFQATPRPLLVNDVPVRVSVGDDGVKMYWTQLSRLIPAAIQNDSPIKGLPTVPVFTGVTGAVNGMPSRPVNLCPTRFAGRGQDGKIAVHPVKVRSLTAVDGLAWLGFEIRTQNWLYPGSEKLFGAVTVHNVLRGLWATQGKNALVHTGILKPDTRFGVLWAPTRKFTDDGRLLPSCTVSGAEKLKKTTGTVAVFIRLGIPSSRPYPFAGRLVDPGPNSGHTGTGWAPMSPVWQMDVSPAK